MSELSDFAASHFQAVIEKRIDEVIDHYAPLETTYVFLEGPRWATLGQTNIAAGWKAFLTSKMTLLSCQWKEAPLEEIAGEMGWIGGIVHMELKIGEQPKSLDLRGTFVVRRFADGKWRIVHEHFSQPHPDPYGVGDWLPAA
ncbi:MAG: nuclear transport factor 2 family protein [Blastocatellia bacterium]|nr:nuclear transport factor 2 family protein [Blastocatellia bacterium]